MTNQRRPWHVFLTRTDQQVLERGDYGHGDDSAFGATPCLLVIDVQRYILGEDTPLLDQIDRYPSGVGERAWRATEAIASLLKVARLSEIPIAYSRLVSDGPNLSLYGHRIRRQQLFGSMDPLSQIPEAIAPQTSNGCEIVFSKYFASAFFGTPLAAWLTRLGIDTTIIVGGSTSGCVRATAVDASSLGYKVVVVEDCTFDRLDMSHAASLLDIWMKYGAVTSQAAVAEYIQTLHRRGK
jgi:maleamate amidohydrolase